MAHSGNQAVLTLLCALLLPAAYGQAKLVAQAGSEFRAGRYAEAHAELDTALDCDANRRTAMNASYRDVFCALHRVLRPLGEDASGQLN